MAAILIHVFLFCMLVPVIGFLKLIKQHSLFLQVCFKTHTNILTSLFESQNDKHVPIHSLNSPLEGFLVFNN